MYAIPVRLVLLDIGQAAYDRDRSVDTIANSEYPHPCAGKIRSREVAIGKVCLLYSFYP